MDFRQAWVIEIVARIVGHAEFFHHAAGAQVSRNREGNETVKTQLLKSVAGHGAGAFSGKSPAPVNQTRASSQLQPRA